MFNLSKTGSHRETGIAQIIILLILLAGIVAGVYLVQRTQIFKPKAYVSAPISCNVLLDTYSIRKEVCGQYTYDTCPGLDVRQPQCDDKGQAYYSCYASQNNTCTKVVYCPQEDYLCPSPSPIACDQFATSTVCGQPAYDTCIPGCDKDGKAIYNCYPSDPEGRKVCTGTIYCQAEDSRCAK